MSGSSAGAPPTPRSDCRSVPRAAAGRRDVRARRLVASEATLTHYATALAGGASSSPPALLSHAEPRSRRAAAVASSLTTSGSSVGGIKLISDGSIQLHTACLSMPYFDRPDECGQMVIDPASLIDEVGADAHRGRLRRSRSTPTVTQAIDHALDAIERCDRVAHPIAITDIASSIRRRCGTTRSRACDDSASRTSLFVNHVYYWGDRHRDRFLGARAPHAESIPFARSPTRACSGRSTVTAP